MMKMDSIASAAAIVLTSCVLPAPIKSAAEAQAIAVKGIEGAWTGPFGQADWTFEFIQQDGRWAGRYISSRGNTWHEVKALVVSGNTVSFEIVSQPVLRFELEVDPSGDRIAGVTSINGGFTRPFSAVRRVAIKTP